ncbi:P-loop containing nucleoside triphosphate hydrolase protein [Rhodocollybia butyracea]|uniref:P-loop containing nucleoside triphosphate hydrolase protein n=1 Tax=Rhodocollybia butyracea TaxID=206335 RepID=A0A9P5Q9C9_9AGAR|nr:P-loop containing nucleoside triphosphate hydrolase protein [Rhodocollybia butyracea]
MASICSDEASFGPAASCRRMDFTLGFQYRIMSIIPSVAFVFFALLRVTFLSQKTRITRNIFDLLSCAKLFFGSMLFVSLLATIVLVPKDDWGFWATRAYTVEVVASVFVLTLSYLHHTRRPAPSTLLTLYLLLSVLMSATQLRTYAITGLDHEAFFPAFATSFSVRVCLLLVEFWHKRRLLKPDDMPTARESTSSLFARLFFVYLYPVLYGGFKRSFDLDDINEFGLPPDMSSGLANAKMSEALDYFHKRRKDAKTKRDIFLPSIRAFFFMFAAPAGPKLLLIAATFSQTYLVQSMLTFIGSYMDDGSVPQDAAHGWALIGAYALVYLSIAFCTSLYWDKVYTMVVCYRAALVSAIFDKSLLLSADAAESEGRSTAVTYMSVDVERVCEGIAFFHETWTSSVSIVVAAVILWFQGEFAMIPPITIMVLFFVITSYIGKRVAKAQKAWMGSTQARLKILTSIMSQIIPVKLLAVEDTTRRWVEPVRHTEIAQLRGFFAKLVIVGVLSSASINFAGLAALGTYVGIGAGDLRPEKLFTILTVVNLLTLPISTVGNCFPLLLASYASMQRIASFLSLPEKDPLDVSSVQNTLNAKNISQESIQQSTEALSLSEHPLPLYLDNATIASKEGGQVLLSDCSVVLNPESLTMVIGPVGAGKSILLKSLLNETYLISGSRTLRTRRVAYAPQDAFLWPTTIRDNIIMDNPYDLTWYSTVLEACALQLDLARIPGSVSGGQKQRISLARAIYAKCDVTLLDDCFSALDAHTAKAVFSRLFAAERGLLRKGAVMLVTHNLQHLQEADKIIVLKQGTVVAQGSFSELRAGHDILRYVGERSESEIEEDSGSADPLILVDTNNLLSPKKKLDEEQKGAPVASSWTPYKFYFRACGWKRLAVCFSCILLYTGLQIGLQILLKTWSESNITHHGPWLGGYAGFTVACFCASFTTLYVYTQLTAPHASIVIHARQLAAVLAAPVTYFQETPLSKLQNRWSSDMYITDFAFPRALQDFTFTAVYVVQVPWLAISIPFLGASYWYLQRVYLATSRQLQRLTMSSKTPMYASFTTTLTGLVTIRAFQSEDHFKRLSMYHLDRAQAPIRTSLNLLTAVLAIAIAALAVGLRGSTSGGFLGIALSQLVSLSQSLINLLLAYTRVENGIVSVERVFELDVQKEEESGESHDLVNWPERGSVEFKDVSLRYREELDPVLHNMSFSIRGGEKLGICGRTGSGKSSTVFALLRGISSPNLSGSILIDGLNISSVPLSILRFNISTVSQTPFLLFASVRDNLTLGCSESIKDNQIWDALDLVGLHQAVSNLEQKLDTIMSADGLQFSNGERQLLCIARVLLQKRKIVVLDEASSSMDSATDRRLRAVLKTALRDVTVISVAHRISTIVDYDRVLVLEDGRIVEVGAPQNLLETEGSLFASLYRTQAEH